MGIKFMRGDKLLKPEIIKAEMGEGIEDRISEERAIKCAQLIAGGVTDEKSLMELCTLSRYKLGRLLRTDSFQKVLKQERQKRAELAMCEIVDVAIDDAKSDDYKIRTEARKFVKSVADGPQPGIVNQNNNINESWDPTKDEQLFERARDMFTDTSRKVVADIVTQMVDDEDGEPTS